MMNTNQGNAYIEYFVVASGVALATIAFYQHQLVSKTLPNDEPSLRGRVEEAFSNACARIAGAPCVEPPGDAAVTPIVQP